MTPPRTRATAATPPNPGQSCARLDLPVIETGKKLTGAEREKFTKKVVAAYRTAGRRVTIREICEATGRSYGAIHSVLSEAGATRRGPRTGGAAGQVKT